MRKGFGTDTQASQTWRDTIHDSGRFCPAHSRWMRTERNAIEPGGDTPVCRFVTDFSLPRVADELTGGGLSVAVESHAELRSTRFHPDDYEVHVWTLLAPQGQTGRLRCCGEIHRDQGGGLPGSGAGGIAYAAVGVGMGGDSRTSGEMPSLSCLHWRGLFLHNAALLCPILLGLSSQ